MEDYVHRIGRTGRAGSMGQATSFYTDRDMVFCTTPLPFTSIHPCFHLRMTFTLDCECILQVLVAQIKKAIADVESGNPVNYAVGKVDLVIITYCDCF